MLARACIDPVCMRAHVACSDVHSAEVVAAGTVLQRAIVAHEFLIELRVRSDQPTPIWSDSLSTTDVANNEASVRRSVWMIRRALVLQEAVAIKQANLAHIRECHNC